MAKTLNVPKTAENTARALPQEQDKDVVFDSLLFDYYGELLNEKQQEIFGLYCVEDYSLSEIGEQLEISRQAAGQLLSRTKKTLLEFESKLNLIDKEKERKAAAEEILRLCQRVDFPEKAEVLGLLGRLTAE